MCMGWDMCTPPHSRPGDRYHMPFRTYVLQVKTQCYPTCRLGLTVPDARGVLDRGFSSCAAPAFCCGPGILNCMQVYVLPMDHREVTDTHAVPEHMPHCQMAHQHVIAGGQEQTQHRVEGAVEIVSGLTQS